MRSAVQRAFGSRSIPLAKRSIWISSTGKPYLINERFAAIPKLQGLKSAQSDKLLDSPILSHVSFHVITRLRVEAVFYGTG
jgi:hypothetical protein